MADDANENAESSGGSGVKWGALGCVVLLLAGAFAFTAVMAGLSFFLAPEDAEPVWTAGLAVSMCALIAASYAAVIGIWVDRDPDRPSTFGFSLSLLILLTMFVGLMQAYLDAAEFADMREDLSQMLEMVAEMAENSNDPRLKKFAEEELGRQAKKNPRVAARAKARRAAARGGKAKSGKTKGGKAGKTKTNGKTAKGKKGKTKAQDLDAKGSKGKKKNKAKGG